jgi:SAM-dependent methyltransferase
MESSTYRKMRALEESHWWFIARRNIIEAVIRRLHLPEEARLLEVGCGTGGNLRMLGQFGHLICVEHDAMAAQQARDRSSAPVLSGSLPDALPQFETGFDLVLALDVIEHVEQDEASLKSLAALLKPAGRLLVTVPAFNFLWSQHDDESHHRRRYRKRDLRRLGRAAELRLDYLSYFNFWLFPAVAVVRLVRKVLPYKETWQDMRPPGPVINELLKWVFSGERHVVGRHSLPFGVSLIAVFAHAQAADQQASGLGEHPEFLG